MPKFFLTFEANCQSLKAHDTIEITGPDALHISKTLRMRVGESLTVTDAKGLDYSCVIDSVTASSVFLKILEISKCDKESDKEIYLFQALVKNDKMDMVIQKAVELGVNHVYPVTAERSIVKLDRDGEKKKLERWNKIALEAAKQCGRGIIPEVHSPVSVKECANILSSLDLSFYCYETAEDRTVKDLMREASFSTIGFYIGPEGGIAPFEADIFDSAGIPAVSLGKLILRTETAGIAVLSMILYETRL